MKEKMNLKRIAIFMAALALVATGCHRAQKFTVSGDRMSLGVPMFADSLVLGGEDFAPEIRTAIQDDKFQFSGEVEKPTYARVMVAGKENDFYKSVILEKGNISFKKGYACGTPLNDATFQFMERLKEIGEANQGDREARAKAIQDEFFSFVAAHKNDPCAIFAILRSHTAMPPKDVVRLIESASPEIQINGNVHSLKEKMKRAL